MRIRLYVHENHNSPALAPPCPPPRRLPCRQVPRHARLSEGMPPEARNNIHQLFNQHAAITRTVTLTQDGYVAVTESTDPKVVAALRGHVQQMSDRLKSGLMVRRHDPAFVEYAAHYGNITHTVQPTATGLKVTVTGKTPDAVKVAQNHASVVTDFASHGWAGHDRDHAKALTAAAKPASQHSGMKPAANTDKGTGPCCESGGACCQGGAARKATAPPLSAPGSTRDAIEDQHAPKNSPGKPSSGALCDAPQPQRGER